MEAKQKKEEEKKQNLNKFHSDLDDKKKHQAPYRATP